VAACCVAAFLALSLTVWLAASERLVDAAQELHEAAQPLLAVSAVCFAAAVCCAGLAWRAGLAGCHACVTSADAIGRYAVGSLVNAAAPLRLGGALRLALFARVGGVRATAATAAAVGAARSACLCALAIAAASNGVLPWWAAFVPLAAGLAATGISVAVCRRHGGAIMVAFPWIAAATAARLAGIATAVTAVGAENPVLAAFIVLPAMELAATVPLTPGNLGVGTVAAATAVAACGAPAETALAGALAIGLCETAASLVLGALGACALTSPGRVALPSLPWAPVSASGRG
jgi:uncharacterized membrane protein YbhN (UPF0104 family)